MVIGDPHQIFRLYAKLGMKKPGQNKNIPESDKDNDGTLPIIDYDRESGLGYTNGAKFKLKNDQPDYLVFAELYENIGATVPLTRILQLSGFTKTKNDQWEMLDKIKAKKVLFNQGPKYFLNKLAVKIRNRASLSDTHLITNNGDMTLRA